MSYAAQPKREMRRRYEGTATRCAWWDAEGGPCDGRPRWHVAGDDGLCEKHEPLFHAKWNERNIH